MTDQIFLERMEFEGRHGDPDDERLEPQAIVVDIELHVDLSVAGASDDLSDTVDYSGVFDLCRAQVEDHSYHLLEGIGEAICADVLASDRRIERVVVNVRKPGVPIEGVLESAGVRLDRSRS